MKLKLTASALCLCVLCALGFARTRLSPPAQGNGNAKYTVKTVTENRAAPLHTLVPGSGNCMRGPLFFSTRMPDSPLRFPKGGPRLAGHIASTADGEGTGLACISSWTDNVAQIRSCSANRPSFRAGDTFFGVQFEDWGYMVMVYYQMYDINTWEYKDYLFLGPQQIPLAACWNPKDNRVYGSFYKDTNMNSYCFGYIDASYLTQDRAYYLETQQLCDMSNPFAAVVFDEEGVCYAIDYQGMLGTVNLETGAFEQIGSTGVKPAYLGSAAWEPEDKCIYWNVVPEDKNGYLYKVSPADGTSELQYKFSNIRQIFGLYALAPEAADGAPAAATYLELDFGKGSLTGNVRLGVPEECYDGTRLSENVGWEVAFNGVLKGAGSVAPGESIQLPVSLDKSDNYEVAVKFANSAGVSPVVKKAMWIGKDTPLAVENAKVERGEGVLEVSWDPVEKSVHDGYIDAGSITYTVMKYPGGEMVANKTDKCFVEVPVDENANLREYSFTIRPHFDELDGDLASTKSIWVGTVHPPYKDNFSSDPEGKYTIIDANGDGNTWGWYSGSNDISCTASTKMDSDDWLISPKVYLEKESLYYISWDVHSYKSAWNPDSPDTNEVTFEIWAGKRAEASAMNIEIVPNTKHVGGTPQTYGAYISPQESGCYYIGIRNLTPMDEGRNGTRYYSIYATNFSVSASVAEGVPGAPENLESVTSRDGSMEVEISGKAPMKNNLGESLASISSIEIYRDGAKVGSLSNVEPGAYFSFTDKGMIAGLHTWSVAAVNEKGKGLAAEVEGIAGPGVPRAPLDLTAVESTEMPGKITVSWMPPKTDVNGVAIGDAKLTYDVVMNYGTENQKTLATNLDANSLEVTVDIEEGEQKMAAFGVFANSRLGTSSAAISHIVPVGDPYRLAYSESFADGTLSYKYGIETTAPEASWMLAFDTDFDGISSQDGDNGFLVYGGNNAPGRSSGILTTGKVAVGRENTLLTFHTLQYPGCENVLDVSAVCDGEEVWLGTYELGGTAQKWVKQSADLSRFIGKIVYIRFQASIVNLNFIFLDNIHIMPELETNLTMLQAYGPAFVVPGEEFSLHCRYENNGTAAVQNHRLVVRGNGMVLSLKNVEVKMKPGVVREETIVLTPNNSWDNEIDYTVSVEAEGDLLPEDNESRKSHLTVKSSSLPCVLDLGGERDADGNAVLSWSPVTDLVQYKSAVTEDFEGYAHGENQHIGNWTLYDGDGAKSGGFDGKNIGVEGLQSSFFVLEEGDKGSKINFPTVSGKKVLASVYNEMQKSDDWIISPELSGESQTLSFWAMSYSDQYPESFEVLVSYTGTSASSFQHLEYRGNIGMDWTCYHFQIEEGVKYFAIRCISQSNLLYLVDDVTFIPKDAGEIQLNLLGYNVYRDGNKVNDAPVKECTFKDTEPAGERYVVTAVYDGGESGRSNVLLLSPAGIGLVEATWDPAAEYFTLFGLKTVRPLPGNIYVVRRGARVTRELLRP